MRWTIARKETVARAVIHGVISFTEAVLQYGLTDKELFGWIKRMRNGIPLKATIR